MPQDAITTTAAVLTRNFGLWQDRAMHQPVMVTHHGRPRAVLVSVDTYIGLKALKAQQAMADQDVRRQAAEMETLRALAAAHGKLGMARISLRGVISKIDDALRAMTGLTAGSSLIDIVQPPERATLAAAVEAVLEGKGAAALAATLASGAPVTIAIAETRDGQAILGAAVLVTPRAPDA